MSDVKQSYLLKASKANLGRYDFTNFLDWDYFDVAKLLKIDSCFIDIENAIKLHELTGRQLMELYDQRQTERLNIKDEDIWYNFSNLICELRSKVNVYNGNDEDCYHNTSGDKPVFECDEKLCSDTNILIDNHICSPLKTNSMTKLFDHGKFSKSKTVQQSLIGRSLINTKFRRVDNLKGSEHDANPKGSEAHDGVDERINVENNFKHKTNRRRQLHVLTNEMLKTKDKERSHNDIHKEEKIKNVNVGHSNKLITIMEHKRKGEPTRKKEILLSYSGDREGGIWVNTCRTLNKQGKCFPFVFFVLQPKNYSEITHLIVHSEQKKPTVKILYALVEGAYVLDTTYIEEAKKLQCWPTEIDHEHKNFPKLSKRLNSRNLFSSKKFFLFGNSTQDEIPRKHLKILVRGCGGILCSSEEQCDYKVLSSRNLHSNTYRIVKKKIPGGSGSFKVIVIKDIIDSICKWEVLFPIDEQNVKTEDKDEFIINNNNQNSNCNGKHKESKFDMHLGTKLRFSNNYNRLLKKKAEDRGTYKRTALILDKSVTGNDETKKNENEKEMMLHKGAFKNADCDLFNE